MKARLRGKMRGSRCSQCRSRVTFTIRRGSPIAIRCADCLGVFCLDCAWWHFGRKRSRAQWMKGLRVNGWKKLPSTLGSACLYAAQKPSAKRKESAHHG